MDAPQRYPLAWPPGRPRTTSRRYGQFRSGKQPISMSYAIGRAQREVDRLGAILPILSSNYRVRLDGTPILNQGGPSDPGVCLYFQLGGKPYAMACDTFTETSQNIAAIAAHIEATRAIERYGVATAAETLQAFAALPPPPSAIVPAKRPWWAVLGLTETALSGFPPAVAAGAIDAAFRELARAAHPDAGGTAQGMAELTQARDEARKAHGL